MKTRQYLQEIESDEFGRIVITDPDLLEKLNGAVAVIPEFMVPDAACGNSNCWC